MKPDSYREQNVECCATCRYNVDVDGVMVSICGFGESLKAHSYHTDLAIEEAKYTRERYFDQGDFLDQWVSGRWVHEFDICDFYQPVVESKN